MWHFDIQELFFKFVKLLTNFRCIFCTPIGTFSCWIEVGGVSSKVEIETWRHSSLTRKAFNFFLSRTTSPFHKFPHDVRKLFRCSTIFICCFKVLTYLTKSLILLCGITQLLQLLLLVATTFGWCVKNALDFFSSFARVDALAQYLNHFIIKKDR